MSGNLVVQRIAWSSLYCRTKSAEGEARPDPTTPIRITQILIPNPKPYTKHIYLGSTTWTFGRRSWIRFISTPWTFCSVMRGIWVALSPHSSRVPAFELMSLSVLSFLCSHHVCVGFLWLLCFPPTSQKHACWWIGCSKFSLSMNVCVSDVPSRVYSCLRSSIPGTLTRIKC